jgi:hypothetical protein
LSDGNAVATTHMSTAQQRVMNNNLKKDVDFKAQHELNEMDKARQLGVDSMAKAFEEMKEKVERVEKKLQGAKVRVGCLENDNAKLRDGMKVFVGKAATDDKLVDIQKDEITGLKKKLRSVMERVRQSDENVAVNRGEGSEIDLLKMQISQLRSQNEHQERIINQLRADVHKSRNPTNARSPGVVSERQSRREEGKDGEFHTMH